MTFQPSAPATATPSAKDRMLGWLDALHERTAGMIAGGRVVSIPVVGHMPFFENPAPSFAAALDFLEAPRA